MLSGVKAAVSRAVRPSVDQEGDRLPGLAVGRVDHQAVPSCRLELPYSPAFVVVIEPYAVSPIMAVITVPAGAGEPSIVTSPQNAWGSVGGAEMRSSARVEKALVNAVVESYLQGISTRRIQEIVSHLGIDQLSPASVSRMARGLDDPVQAFLLRPIEQAIPYLFVDACSA